MNNILVNRLIILIFFATILSWSDGYCAAPIEIETLRGLRGMMVLVEELPNDIEEQGQLTRDQIKTDVELKLRMAGIKVIDEKEHYNIPGWPTLYVNVSFIRSETKLVVFTDSISLKQRVTLTRKSKIQTMASTWSEGSFGSIGSDNISRIRYIIKDLVDVFINDYLSVNPPPKVK